MRRFVRVLAAVLSTAALAACGGDSSSSSSPTTPATSAATAPDPEAVRAATAYAHRMRPIAGELGRALRGFDLARNRRDFDGGVALLRVRKRMARVTADPGLLLAHDRLAKAVARAGTLLVAAPGSQVAVAARQAGVPPGTQTAVALVGPELGAWASETEQQLRDAGAAVPPWLDREAKAARRLGARAADELR